MTTAAAGGGEFDLIDRLAELFGTPPSAVVRGIGDDCAILADDAAHYLLWTMDTLIEGVHFDLSFTPLRLLGRKTLAVNVSDIAAMGGTPLYALLSLGWPPGRPLREAWEVAAGLQEAAREFGVAIIGGDTVQSPVGVNLSLTLLGRVPRDEVLTRDGAREGDRVYVTGPLGEAAAGLEMLRWGLELPEEMGAALAAAHLDPKPQVAAGQLLAREHLASALIDLSDGVASDLFRICRASQVGAVLAAERIPIQASVRQVAALLDRDPLDLALRGGEDYRLLFTVAPGREQSLADRFMAQGLPAPIGIGTITQGERVLLITPAGQRDISGSGFDHFGGSGA